MVMMLKYGPSKGADLKVAVIYRVIQHWRVPVFARISQKDGMDVTIFHGEDFSGTKIVNFQGEIGFNAVKLKSLNVTMGTSNGSAYIPFSPGLWSELKRLNPDIIVSEGASNLFNNLICFIYSKMNKVPIVQWGLGEIEGREKSLHRRIADIVFRFVERNSSAAIAYSSFGAEYYKRVGIPRDRVFTAVNVVDTEARMRDMKDYCRGNALPYPSPVPSIFHILFVGALSENKGVDTLIRAFASLRAAVGEDARLTIVGDGPFRDALQALVEELGVSEHVSMPGQVIDGIAKHFYAASLFVLPGLGGLAVSDALAHGVPVIATVGDGCEKDLIQHGVNGYYFPSISVDSLSDILKELYYDKSKLSLLRIGAQNFSKSKFNIQGYVDSIVNAIQVTADV